MASKSRKSTSTTLEMLVRVYEDGEIDFARDDYEFDCAGSRFVEYEVTINFPAFNSSTKKVILNVE